MVHKGIFDGTIEGIDGITQDVDSPKVILVKGNPGTMKTTFLLTLLTNYLNKHENETGMYLTLEQDRASIARTAKKLKLKLPHNLKIVDLAYLRQEAAKETRVVRQRLKELKEGSEDKFDLLALLMDEDIADDVIETELKLNEWPETIKARRDLDLLMKGRAGTNWVILRKSLAQEQIAQPLIEFLVPKGSEGKKLKRKKSDIDYFGHVEYLLASLHKSEGHKFTVFSLDSFTLLNAFMERGGRSPREELTGFFEQLREYDLYSFVITESAVEAAVSRHAEYLADGIIELGKQRDSRRKMKRFVLFDKMREAKISEEPHLLTLEDKGGVSIGEPLFDEEKG